MGSNPEASRQRRCTHWQMTASSTSASGGNAGRDEFGIGPESDSCHNITVSVGLHTDTKKTMGKESKKTRKTAAGRIKRAAAAVESVRDTAATAVRSNAVRAAGGLAASGTVAREKGSALVHRGVSGVFVGCEAVVGYVSNQDWISVTDPARFLYAGTRGTSRGFEEARLVWESIPEQLRALGPEEVAKRLDGFDWSHVVAQQGRRRRSGERDIRGCQPEPESRCGADDRGRDRGGVQGSHGDGVCRCAGGSGTKDARRRLGRWCGILRDLGSGIRPRVSTGRYHPGGNASAHRQ